MSECKEIQLELKERLAKEIGNGVLTTFSTLLGLKPECGPYRIEEKCVLKADVSGFISITQESGDSTFIVSFPKETVFAVLSNMFRKPHTEMDSSVKGAVGELTNAIYGVIKAEMNKDGFSFKMAIPNVVIGEQHSVVNYKAGPTLVIPVTTSIGPFNVLLSFPSVAKQKAA